MKLRTNAVYPAEAVLVTSEIGPPDGQPVLLSHPLLMGPQMFEPLMERLAARGYRAITWNHRGHGSNTPPKRERHPEVSLTLLTAQAADVVKGLNLHKPHFVGQGLGGMVGLRLAAWRPDLIASLTTIASSAETEPHREAITSLADHIEKHGMTGELDLGSGTTPVVKLLSHASFGAWTQNNQPELVTAWEQRFARLARIAPSMRAFAARESVIQDLHGCSVPVLSIAGAEDIVYPPPISGAAIATTTGGQYVTIARAGHSVALEQPDAVVSHLEHQFASADPIHGF